MIHVTRLVAISETEITLRFLRAPGPGGQNVNKVETAVQLRFDAAHSPALTDEIRARLAVLAGRRMTAGGVLVLDAHRHRTQARNRDDAIARLVDLLRRAAEKPKPRKVTKPTLASKQRRLEGKQRRGEVKKLRGGIAGAE
jgi:ribosome-associated protein